MFLTKFFVHLFQINYMKTCKFQYKEKNICIFGSVTSKDGKISISLSNAMKYSPYIRMKAKNLANEIVQADFIHELAIDFKETKSTIDNRLVQELYKHTIELKELYITKTKESADRTFVWASERKDWSTKQWYDNYNLPYTLKHQGTDREYPLLDTKIMSQKGYSLVYSGMCQNQDKVRLVIKLGLDSYKASLVKDAEKHYLESMEKLSIRLNSKGITDDAKFTITSAKIADNFECYIHHDLGVTKAWTIIAEGPVQQPHYRYLVK